MENKIIDFTRDYYKYSLRDDKSIIERYVDYRDEFPQSAIEEILEASEPLEKFYEIIDKWDIDSDDWYYENDFWEKLKNFCEENEYDFQKLRVLSAKIFGGLILSIFIIQLLIQYGLLIVVMAIMILVVITFLITVVEIKKN